MLPVQAAARTCPFACELLPDDAPADFACSGRCTDLSFLDPIVREDTPPQAIRLAAGELALRITEGRRRQAAGLGEALLGSICHTRMHGKAGGLTRIFGSAHAPMSAILVVALLLAWSAPGSWAGVCCRHGGPCCRGIYC